jgi:hypothetical protein
VDGVAATAVAAEAEVAAEARWCCLLVDDGTSVSSVSGSPRRCGRLVRVGVLCVAFL